MKVITTIRIEKDILEKAQEHGLNISKACEFALKTYIEALDKANPGLGARLIICAETPSVSALPAGGQVGDLEVESSNPSPGTHIDWEAFREYLLKDLNERVARDYLSYAHKWKECFLNRDLSKVLMLSPGRRRMVMASLSALAKFLGAYKDWQQLTEKYNLKWAGKSTTDIILDRISKVEDPDEVFQWIKLVKFERPELNEFMDLIAITGMRLVEAVNCYNLIIRLAKERKLQEYYANETLEHYKFKEIFVRGKKKVFISFAPEQLIKRITENQPLTSWMSVQKLVQKKGLPARFADVRELHASIMTKYLKEPEINFLHGRISTNVFMTNYFNPSWITDLKTRALQGISEILEKIA